MSKLPDPPGGLPGHANRTVDPEAMRLLQLGADYAEAAARGEKRTLWNLHQEMVRVLNERGADGKRDAYAQARRDVAAPRPFNYTRPDQVYFVRAGEGPIKIGIAADVDARVRTLQTAHAEQLIILAVTEGGQAREFEYHGRFAEHRLNGEWFAPHSDILAEVERINSERAAFVPGVFS